jgi:hypothetical protein
MDPIQQQQHQQQQQQTLLTVLKQSRRLVHLLVNINEKRLTVVIVYYI